MIISSVLRTPLYRGVIVALFLSGVGFSAATPVLSLFLVDELHASLRAAGLFALTNLTAPLAGYLVGARSDRIGERLALFRVCAVLGAVGWAAIAVSTQLWMPVVINAVVLGFTGAATSQLFAALHDDPGPDIDGVVAVARMSLVAGWVVGPVLGSVLAGWAGPRPTFLATAACLLAQMLPLGRRTAPGRAPADRETPPRPGELVPLIGFTVLCVLVYAGDTVKFAYLPLHLRDGLHLPAGLRGAIIGVQPLTEVLVIPVAVALAPRLGAVRLLALGGLLGVVGDLLLAGSGQAAGLFAGQLLIGCQWGVFGGLGIIVAQRLLPSAVATASAVFVSAEPVSAAVGGLAGGLAVGPLGIPAVFLVPAALAAVATIMLSSMPGATSAGRSG